MEVGEIMSDLFLTLESAAILEGIKYDTFKKKVQRNQDNFIVKSESSSCGGKDRILISIQSLSLKARRAYQASKEIEQSAKSSSDKSPWYLDIDLNQYISQNKDEYYEAVRLKQKIEEYLEVLKVNVQKKTEFTAEFAESLGMSGRNFKRKLHAYFEGNAWAIKKYSEDKQNYDFYKVLALCRAPRKDKGERVSMTEEMMATIQNIWFDPMFAVNQRTMAALYEMLQDMAAEKGWIQLPSYPTVNRYINELNEKYASEHYLATFGEREYKRSKLPKRERDIGSLKVMELVQGDAHTFDCWVEVELDGKKTAVRPYLVGLIDVRSRVLVGWSICICPNNRVIKKTLMHMMYPKVSSPVEGVPRIILIDNGKDWTAQTLTGRPRTERVTLDGDIKGFYKSIGIEDDMRALPYQPWTKAQIERFFRTLTNKFAKSLESYTGTLTGSKTAGKIKKDIPKLLESNKLMGIYEFAQLFENWLNSKYHNKEHSGLRKQGESNPTPFAVYQEADRYMMAAPPIDYARLLLLSTEERLVYPTGFKLFNNTYQHQLLGRYIDKYITVRYDPDDLSIVYAYNKSGEKICDVRANELLNPLAAKDDELLRNHILGQKRHMKDVKKGLEELRTPYEERQNAKPVILPELTGEAPAVTTLPQDKQYKEELKRRKKQQAEELNTAFTDVGMEAFALIKSKKAGAM